MVCKCGFEDCVIYSKRHFDISSQLFFVDANKCGIVKTCYHLQCFRERATTQLELATNACKPDGGKLWLIIEEKQILYVAF